MLSTWQASKSTVVSGFRTNDTDLNTWHEGRMWLDHCTDRVLASFGPSISPFCSATILTFGNLSSFGNAVQYDEVVQSEGKILDLTLSLAEVVWEIDGFGRVVEIVRKFLLTPGQAMSIYARDGLPAKLVELADKGDTGKYAYHHAYKNDDWRPYYKLGVKGRPWISRYCCEVEATVLRESGYQEMPFFAPRWQVDAGQSYGLGPGFTALPSARILQRMEDATVRARPACCRSDPAGPRSG